ncbi:MAG: hypothetical protein ABIJ65_05410 [Chloroflexota bacterium]
MLPELSTRLTKISEQKRLKLKLEGDLHTVETELQAASTRFSVLASQLEKEKVDVEKLEHLSLKALFYSVLGSKEQQLDKERQELLSAQLKYQQSRKQVTFLEQDKNSLIRQLGDLANIEAEYELLLSEKEDLLRRSEQPVARELIEVSGKIANLNSQLKEIAEAISAGNRVISGLEAIIASLESAESWGVWDMLGGGILATAVKHSRIDDARTSVESVQEKMSHFKRELADVQENIDLQIDISEFTRFADFFFDNLITDWLVQKKIETSLTQSKKAKEIILQALQKLDELRKRTQQTHNALQEKQVLLIEQA